MPKQPRPLLPHVKAVLRQMGSDLRDARRRRGDTMEIMAQRLGVTRATLARLEAGDPSVRLQVFIQALHILGKLDAVAALLDGSNDRIGREMFEETHLPKRVRRTAKP